MSDDEKNQGAVGASATPSCSLPPYDEWRKLPPDEAARMWAQSQCRDAEEEGLMAALLEWFPQPEESSLANAKEQPRPSERGTTERN
jgi:hypothetical protein